MNEGNIHHQVTGYFVKVCKCLFTKIDINGLVYVAHIHDGVVSGWFTAMCICQYNVIYIRLVHTFQTIYRHTSYTITIV